LKTAASLTQTYDEWIATGESSYSGGLYLAALRATARMAEKLGDSKTADAYDALEAKASNAYIKKLLDRAVFPLRRQRPGHRCHHGRAVGRPVVCGPHRPG